MHQLQSIDIAIFRLINIDLSNPVLDRFLPFFSSNALFIPAVIVTAALLVWKGGVRGRLFVGMLLLVTAIGDGVICNQLKDWLDRPRPFSVVPDANLVGIGRGRSGSMPSSHTANWFAAALVAGIYYRRSLWVLLPVAVLIGFSRIYLGAHFFSDVLAGALLGVTYAAAILWLANQVWRTAGRQWYPLWWRRLPSLTNPAMTATVSERSGEAVPEAARSESTPSKLQTQQWLRLGYLLIAVLLVARWFYIAGDTIQLSEDEAYQWLWSKHLDLSYYSKPPLIAYTQFLGTTLWGDTEFGVRFFSPVLAALLAFFVFRFLTREANIRAGFAFLLMTIATPLLAVGATLMTIDPLSVFFWTMAMLIGWRAIQRDSTADWALVGVAIGLGFLSKYTGFFQWICWGLVFVLLPEARRHLRRPGPYLAFAISMLATIPVLIWNARNDWITVTHLVERGGLDDAWKPTLKYFGDFAAAELGVLNPVFLVGTVWASIAFWKHYRTPLLVYLFSMGAPLFIFYLLYTARAQVQPNWIAPAVVPLFCLAAVYWEHRWRSGAAAVRPWFAAGTAIGFALVIVLHDTDLVRDIAGRYLPARKDPLRRVRSWEQTAQTVGQARAELLAEGKPVFIIGDHYGITGLLSFYLPEAKQSVCGQPLVYYQSTEYPKNQFYFWPGYENRTGQNAIYVQETKQPEPPPQRLVDEFESVTDLGVREILYKGRVYHRIQLFACRNLK